MDVPSCSGVHGEVDVDECSTGDVFLENDGCDESDGDFETVARTGASHNIGGGDDAYKVSDDNHCLVVTSSGGSTLWTPLCNGDLTPCIGQSFTCVDDGIQFYKYYAAACNFEIRLGKQRMFRDGTVRLKYVHCNKEGTSRSKGKNSLCGDGASGRTLSLSRCNCNAKFVLRKCASGYVVSDFVETHNHLIATPAGAQFMKCRRSLSFSHMTLLAACSRANIGPAGAYNLSKELAGGHNRVGALKKDFQNHQRDKNNFVGINDAQMVIDRFTNKRQNSNEYFFEYCTENNTLTRLFWADPIARRNYRAYGDVVSFDATYSLNKYRLVFVPFTGVDNHMNSITFCGGLLSAEDEHSYIWLLEAFMKCMGAAPRIALTDEDGAVRLAIRQVMPETHHRLCMWHIMKKIPVKIPMVTPRQISFADNLKKLIYEYHVEPTQFEEKWKLLLEEYEMTNHVWLAERFEKRAAWIPCYFKDIPLGGLLRTTSRSESANSFFGMFLKKGLSLLGFMLGFDSAMDSQRNTQARCDHETRMKFPKILTPFELEKQAAEVYTTSVFREFQKEILASCYTVSITSVLECEGITKYQLRDRRFRGLTFEVQKNQGAGTFNCTCKLFEKVGFLCRHILSSFNSAGIHSISAKYILDRWTRHAIVYANEGLQKQFIEQCDNIHEPEERSSEIWIEFKSCLEIVGMNASKKQQMLRLLKQMAETLRSSDDDGQHVDKNQFMAELVGARQPEEVTILPPTYVHTKGSGKRIVGDAEKGLKKSKRRSLCFICKKPGHNSRTCTAGGGSDCAEGLP